MQSKQACKEPPATTEPRRILAPTIKHMACVQHALVHPGRSIKTDLRVPPQNLAGAVERQCAVRSAQCAVQSLPPPFLTKKQ
jgi:hypothetical protein